MINMKLPNFIYKRIMSNNTSLGDNKAFPPENDYKFEYFIIKNRYKQIIDKIKEFDDITDLSIESLSLLLSKLIKECKEIEKPLINELKSICLSTINDMFEIPDDTINFNINFVNKITPKESMRIQPEKSDTNFEFNDLNDFNNLSNVLMKRRLVNSLIQGISYDCLSKQDFYLSKIYQLNRKLPLLYEKIIAINDFLLFNKEEKIDEKNIMQGGYVEVHLGMENEKTLINVDGIIFPYVLNELIRGLFELFSSHGLPNDNKKAEYIIKQADFLLAEPWDLRIGVPLWNILNSQKMETKIMPYFFTLLCELPVDEFNDKLREVFAKTKKGKQIIEDLVNQAKEFYNDNDIPQMPNNSENVLNDGYLSLDDLNNCVIEEDITNETDYEELLYNANIDDFDFELIQRDIPKIVSKNSKHEHNYYDIKVTVNGVEIPDSIIYFRCEDVYIGSLHTYQLHIEINEQYRKHNIAYKLFYAFIKINGNACSLYINESGSFYKEHNRDVSSDNAIQNLFAKLNKDSHIEVKNIKNKLNNIIGVIAIYK